MAAICARPPFLCEHEIGFTIGRSRQGVWSHAPVILFKVALMCEVDYHATCIEHQRFTAPEKAMVAERVRPFGPPPAFDPSTSTLIFGEHDAVLVDTLMTVAETEALANWVALHHRDLVTIYITHGHFDHFV